MSTGGWWDRASLGPRRRRRRMMRLLEELDRRDALAGPAAWRGPTS